MGTNHEANFASLNAITQELTQLGATTETTVKRYSALLELHACACLDGDMKKADELRLQIQSAIDTVLDAHARSADLQRDSRKILAEITKIG